MAAVTTIAAGNWSSGSSVFSGGSGVGGVPTNADTVTITHAITLDTTTAVADSIQINAGGDLIPRTSGDSKLVVDKGITTASSATAKMSVNMSSAPQYKCELLVNADRTTGAGNGISINGDFDFIGAPKTAWTYANGVGASGALAVGDDGSTGKEITVDDATGWRQGDQIVFATTQAYNATPRVDVLTLSGSYTNGSTSLKFTSGLVYAHAGKCLVGNLTRNVVIGPATSGDVAFLVFAVSTRATAGKVRDVMFDRAAATSSFPAGVLRLNGANSSMEEVANCAFNLCTGTVFNQTGSHGGPLRRENNIWYCSTAASNVCFGGQNNTAALGDDTSPVIFQGYDGYTCCIPKSYAVEPKISGCVRRAVSASNYDGGSLSGGGVWSCSEALYLGSGLSAAPDISRTRYGCGPSAAANYPAANNATLLNTGGPMSATLTGCAENTSGGAFIAGLAANAGDPTVEVFDRNGDTAVQEVYGSMSNSVPEISRSTASGAFTRSTSALRMKWTGTTNKVVRREFQVLSKSGEPITLIGYVKKSGTNAPISGDAAYGSSTLPYVEVSGLGITPVRITMDAGTAADVWEKFSFLPGSATEVVQNSGADGLLTVALVGQSAVANAACYFAGLPIAPFVTRARHYGYLFDETSPTRTANSTISAAEATAAAYAGIAVTWGASSSSTAISAARTFQELYDYTQAQACLNVGSALPLTGAGLAGAPALFAAGAITVSTGGTLSGVGSLAMGANLLTYLSDFTFSGGTFAQSSATPEFAGGVVTIPSASTNAWGYDGCEIKFGAAGSYNLSGATFGASVHFTTSTGALAVTVSVPSGISYTVEGANITVTEPVLSAPITWAGAENGTTVLLYNDSNAGALIDTQTNVTGGYSLDIELPHPDVAVGDSLRLRYGHAGYYAGELQGTMTASGIAFVGSMTTHPVYAGWGLVGSDYDQANGGPYTMDGANLQVDISVAGTTSGLKTQLGAWTQYLMTLPAGLDAFFGAWDLLALNQIRQNVGVVDVKIDVPTAGALFTFTDNNVNYYRSDFTFPGNVQSGHGLIAMTYNAEPFVATVSGESVITGDPVTVAAAVRSELASELTRISDLAKRGGVVSGTPVVIPPGDGSIVAGDVEIGISTAEDGTVTLVRV